jgi:hypothetical protein
VLFLVKNHQNVSIFFENGLFYHKFRFFFQWPKCDIILLLGEGVATFMSIGYNFKSSLK